MSYAKINMSHLMPGSAFDWLQKPNKGSMTRQEAVNPTPQQAVAQTAQTRPSAGPQQSSGTGNARIGGETWWRGQSASNHPERNGATNRTLTESEVEAEKNGPNGEVVWLADQVVEKPKNTLTDEETTAAAKRHQELSKHFPAMRETLERVTPAVGRHDRSQVDEQNANDESRVDALADTIQADKDGTAAGGTTYSGYDDIMRMMQANMETEGDMARRQRSREVVTGLGDLVSSIANMWATTKGAPNSYDNSKGMTATSQARYERELARRKAQNESILNYYRVKKAAENDERIRKYREDIEEREQRRLDETARHNKEMERLAAEKEQNSKAAKEEEQERKNKDSENKRRNDDKRTDAYVTGQKNKGNKSSNKGGTKKSTSSNTPPSRRSGNSNGNNTRPSKRK